LVVINSVSCGMNASMAQVVNATFSSQFLISLKMEL